jgi:hypothetical protein
MMMQIIIYNMILLTYGTTLPVVERSWARELDPPRCAYWIVTECPQLKNGKQCDRIHECKSCGFIDDE